MNKYISYIKNWRDHIGTFSWLGAHTKPYMPPIIILLVLNAITALISVGMSLLIKRIVDNATSQHDISKNVILYAVVLVFSLFAGAFSGILSTLLNERFAYNIRRKVYGSILRTRVPDILKYHSGDLLTRMTSDITTITSGITDVLPSLLSLVISFFAAFITMAWFDLKLAFFSVVLGPVAALISIVMGKKIKAIQVKLQESESAYRSNMQETVGNIVVIKSFEGQDAAEAKLDRLQDNRMYWIMKRLKIGTISRTALSGTFQFGFVVIFAYSATQLSIGAISVGTLMLFISLVGQIQSPVSDLAQKIPRVISILASAGRVQELEELAKEDSTHLNLKPGGLSVDIKELSFSYGSEELLHDSNINIKDGEFVALMGSSGIGKTTLIRLLLAFYLPQTGCIELVDTSGDRVKITAGAREYIAYVPQGNTLMSGTISDNLKIGNSKATEEEIWEALEVVAAAEFVRASPNGLNTIIGERGMGLSEGQAQRLSIARALIKGAPLLILDEATSALDEETELAVLRHLRSQDIRRTCILITHRRSVLSFCDRCIRIHNRDIIEQQMESISELI